MGNCQCIWDVSQGTQELKWAILEPNLSGPGVASNSETPVPPDIYTVKTGDYLGRIARLHQMSVSDLKTANNIRRSVIYPGQELKVNPILRGSREWLKISEINWDNLMNSLALQRYLIFFDKFTYAPSSM